jgi:hypothetical protein
MTIEIILSYKSPIHHKVDYLYKVIQQDTKWHL